MKMDLWGFTERLWKSARGVLEEKENIPWAGCTITQLETASAGKARYFLSPPSLSRKIDFTGIWKGLDTRIGIFTL